MVHLPLVIAFVLIALGIGRMIPYLRARNWVPSTGTVVSNSEIWSVVVLRFLRIKYYFPRIEYEYQFKGRSYISNRVSFEKQNVWIPEVDSWGTPIGNSQRFWASWSEGTTIPIYIDPNNPSESVVIKNLDKKRRSHHLALITGGFLVLLIWAFLNLAT